MSSKKFHGMSSDEWMAYLNFMYSGLMLGIDMFKGSDTLEEHIKKFRERYKKKTEKKGD